MINNENNENKSIKSIKSMPTSADASSTMLLIQAGASMNHRCGLGFSPTFWGMLGGKHGRNEAVDVLMGASKGKSKSKSKIEGSFSLYCSCLVSCGVVH